jgi:hypothetical protein
MVRMHWLYYLLVAAAIIVFLNVLLVLVLAWSSRERPDR